MHDAWLLMTSALASLLGFAMLALSQDRHWTHVTGLHPTRRALTIALRWAGLCIQAVVCVPLVVSQGPGFGALLWGLGLTLMAVTVTSVLTCWPQALIPLAGAITLHPLDHEAEDALATRHRLSGQHF